MNGFSGTVVTLLPLVLCFSLFFFHAIHHPFFMKTAALNGYPATKQKDGV